MTPADVFHRAHGFVRDYDLRYVDCFAVDGVLELPFAPAPLPKQVRGREAIRALLAPRYAIARASGRRIADYRNLRIHETRDPHVIVAEFDVVGIPAGAGAEPFTLSFIHVIEVVDDQIAMQRDYFDSLVMAERLRVS
jgi:ketosteroid isomerase-like protein